MAGAKAQPRFPSIRLLLLRLLSPGVLQGYGAIEDQLAGGAVFIEGEVAEALVLVAQFGPGVLQGRFTLGDYYFQGVRVQELLEVTAGVGLGHRSEERRVGK